MIDGGLKGVPAAQIQRLTALVRNAVGADMQRGDSVIVESMAFAADPALTDNKAGILSYLPMGQVVGLLKLLLIAVVGLVALRMFKSRGSIAGDDDVGETLLRAQTPEMLALAQQAATGDAEAQQELDALRQSSGDNPLLDQEIALAQVDGRIKMSALKQIGDAIKASPPEAASVIRQWMNA